jgi:hypothetical protein
MIFLAAGLKISDLVVLIGSSIFDKTISSKDSVSEGFLFLPYLEVSIKQTT